MYVCTEFKELSAALETVNTLREDQKSKNTMRDTIEQLSKLKDAYQSQFYLQQEQQQQLPLSAANAQLYAEQQLLPFSSGPEARVPSAAAARPPGAFPAGMGGGMMVGGMLGSNVIDQLARALRDGDFGLQVCCRLRTYADVC
jgi:hypothetical protein